MKISVVIPTYKRPLLLMECIKSLARQHFDKDAFEVLVVSDGPDLLTKQVVVSWKHTGLLDIEYIPLPEKRGPAAARNAGWRLASGEVIAFTDDDCLPDERWLETIWEHAYIPRACAYAGRILVPLPDTPTDFEWNTSRLETAEFVTANCACPRKVLETTGGFDERYSMAWREDSDLEFSILDKQIPLESLPEAVVVHPVRKAPWGVSMREQKKTMFNALLQHKFPERYRKSIREAPPWYYYGMIVSALGGIAALIAGLPVMAAVLASVWLVLWMGMAAARLRSRSHRLSHVLEMFVTSACIPFLSVYWHWYGQWKFRA
ncbi:glycosyltransferase family 2 protein [Chitinophaga lutea]